MRQRYLLELHTDASPFDKDTNVSRGCVDCPVCTSLQDNTIRQHIPLSRYSFMKIQCNDDIPDQ